MYLLVSGQKISLGLENCQPILHRHGSTKINREQEKTADMTSKTENK